MLKFGLGLGVTGTLPPKVAPANSGAATIATERPRADLESMRPHAIHFGEELTQGCIQPPRHVSGEEVLPKHDHGQWREGSNGFRSHRAVNHRRIYETETQLHSG